MGPRRLPSRLAAKIAMKIRFLWICIGNPNEFSQIINTHLIDIFVHPMHTYPRLPPITPDYTRLHPTFDPDYPTPGAPTGGVWTSPSARRATIPRFGGRPSQEFAGDHPKNWRATIPRTGGRPSRKLAVRAVARRLLGWSFGRLRPWELGSGTRSGLVPR